ncbi:MAG: arginine--tRNA ligase [Alphaproteobacteria bacterium]|nr:arginine--tRNA ligase [Alphaproteobacteria bacterium]
MPSLTQNLTEIFEAAFTALDLPVQHARVQVSGQGQDAQFQCNGALACAKPLKKNPREIAQSIIDQIQNCHPDQGDSRVEGSKKDPSTTDLRSFSRDDIFESLSIGGPGFINITLKDEYISAFLGKLSTDENLGIEKHSDAETIVLDYGGPNIAKAMHVGHLRSSIIGDSLRRLYDYAGYHTIGDVHMGDWGTPMGMILSELELMKYDGEITMEMLAEIYPKASAACKEDEGRMALAREATRKLQDGDTEYTKRWREFIDVSIEGMKKNFDALGVHFDEWKGESDAHPFIDPMVEDLKSRGIAYEDDGALIIDVSKEDDNKEVPPLILLKSDGAVLYGTTDLATIIDRMKSHVPKKIIYIVDQRQSLHFEQVFRAAKKGEIAPGINHVELIHAGFGTMNGPDGKPFKTRAGGVMKLEDLIEMGIEKATARLDEAELAKDMDEEERKDVAHKVAIAALKFADLQNNRIADYVFDIDRMTSFEGKTGPYLLYQAVRIQSLLKKAGIDKHIDAPYKIEDADRELALLLGAFPDHFKNALKHNTPHVLCDYAYKLAQEFSSFYGNCHILSESDEVSKLSRLKLCQQTHRQLLTILELLGIQVPERM